MKLTWHLHHPLSIYTTIVASHRLYSKNILTYLSNFTLRSVATNMVAMLIGIIICSAIIPFLVVMTIIFFSAVFLVNLLKHYNNCLSSKLPLQAIQIYRAYSFY